MKIIFSALLMAVMVLPCHAQKVKPALNLTNGQTYYSITDLNTILTQTVSGQQMSFTIGMATKSAFKVLAIRDTIYDIEVSYKSIGMKMNSAGGGSAEYSSGTNAQDVFSKVLTNLIDKPFNITLSKSGKVKAVSGIDNMIAAVFSNLSITDSAQVNQLKGQLMQSFGEKAVKSNLEQTFAIYPGTKVTKGDKWTINTSLQSVMLANVNTVYQLQDVTASNYIIHGDAKIATIADNAPSQMNGMPVKYNLKGTMTADIKADKNTGWIVESKLKEDLSGQINVLDNPQVPGGMDVPMNIHADVVNTDK